MSRCNFSVKGLFSVLFLFLAFVSPSLFEMLLVTVPSGKNAGAVCLDGSPPGYWIRKATTPQSANKWIVHLQGGGWCYKVLLLFFFFFFFPSHSFSSSRCRLSGNRLPGAFSDLPRNFSLVFEDSRRRRSSVRWVFSFSPFFSFARLFSTLGNF